MKQWVVLDDGLIVRSRHLPDTAPAPEGPEWLAVLPPLPIAQLDRWWHDGAALLARQPLPQPVLTHPGAETHLAWTGLPDGTTATVHDGETGALLGTASAEAGALTVELAEPGPYRITLTAPAPAWAPLEMEITA